MSVRGRILLVAVTAACLGTWTAVAAAPPQVTGAETISERVVTLTVATSAFTEPTKVDVIFPVGYEADPARRWPVTYVTAGTMNNYDTFRTFVNGVKLAEGYPSIIVSPDGNSGYWSDWYNGGAFGAPKYETFVIDELIDLIDGRYRTIPDRAHRLIFGISMGGYGTMMLAARHPDRFAAAATLSGAVDSNLPYLGAALSASSMFDGGAFDAINGPRATQEVRWHGRNPTDIADNLRDVDLQVRSANGTPNPGLGENLASADSVSCVIESGVYQGTRSFHARLEALGKQHVYVDYGAGCHTVANFKREIVDTLAHFERVLADPPAPPPTVTYRSIDPQYEVFGWRITLDRPVLEFSRLLDARRDGFTLEGSGTAVVRTPGAYPRNTAVPVKVKGPGGVVDAPVIADDAGRLNITVPLGPANTGQQYALGTTTKVGRATVSIVAPAPACRSRRVFTVTLPRGLRVRRITLNGRRLVAHGGKVRVDLAGRPRGVVRLVITGRTKAGRSKRIVRRYRTCTARR